MGKKLTHEEFMIKVKEKNEYVQRGDIEILGKYVNRDTPIKCRCIIHDYIWYPIPGNLYKGGGCTYCRSEKISKAIIISHDDFMAKVLEKNNHVKNNEIEIIGKYNGAGNPIKCICHVHNLVFYPTPSNLYRGQGCNKCKCDKISLARKTPHEEFVQKVNSLHNNITVIGEYINNHTPIEFKCDKGHTWYATPSSILSGTGCPYCSGRNPIIGETSLWDTRPDVASLLKDLEDGYRYSAGSGKKIDFICPDCQTVQSKRIADVCQNGLTCSSCSDGISYAEKFMSSVLTQLKIDFQRQVSKATSGFEWIKYGYKYDFYIKIVDKKFFIETDGGLGHGNKTFYGEDDVEGAKRDLIKDQMALEHGIQVIRIDCNYKKGERFEYIKENIITSQLSNLFDLSLIDWALCDRQAQKKIIVQIANLYNDGYTMSEMITILNYDKRAIQRWLRQARKIGLCEYNARELAARDTSLKAKNAVAVNRYTTDNKYVNSYSSLTEAALDVGSSASNIRRACNDSWRVVCGYKYYRANDFKQPDKTKIINLTIQN